MWEHFHVETFCYHDAIQAVLEEYEEDGWVLVSATADINETMHLFFKRRKE